jgi:hypothetical protein
MLTQLHCDKTGTQQTLHMGLTTTGFIPTASEASVVIHQAIIFLCKVSLCCYIMFLPTNKTVIYRYLKYITFILFSQEHTQLKSDNKTLLKVSVCM